MTAEALESLFRETLAAVPLVAILRGIRPEEVEVIGAALVESGIRLIEVPLNSPDPFNSISRLVKRFGEAALIGAGTVIQPDDVLELAEIGAGLVISPHTDCAVIEATRRAGLISLPGIATPSEAFDAIAAGAHALKLFPMEMIGIGGMKAMKAVLPPDMPLIAVGGVGAANLASLRNAGCAGFGLGSSLYKPGMNAGAVRAAAEACLAVLAEG
ncbi:2-dehydro-3-deoxy-6-phosphogalactonate aldolase [Rhabdaerophilum sp. SD176]|uniref:2-dehydro-3-deoxy-6-phosphogalactonate aldolase n=1 Tax=Rhabdaerophilum sp. SD176 TaxID=2983548 RepID=UPI0024DFA6AE|nr:2-dehydro-3-deoxy-6-phosphogalactonate aldolase [Rhabdaerophilum sp. SD176]